MLVKIEKIYLSLLVGNDKEKYVSKETLHKEAKKYLNENIYMCELDIAIENVKQNCKSQIIVIMRKLLCLWKCYKPFKEKRSL